MAEHDREVTFFTQAQRRPLRFGETPTGERLPINPSIEQVVAFIIAMAIFGPLSLVAAHFIWFARIVGFFLLPAVVYRIVGTVQDGGNAPAVAALNSWHTVVSWAHHKARHLQRPERFDGTTRIVRDP